MANIKLFGAIFTLLLAVATATTYTTTVTTITTTEDEGSSFYQEGSKQQCESEIQSKDFNMCESFLSMDQQQGGGRLKMIVENREQGQDQQKQCCQQLEQVRAQCRCAAIEDVVKRQMRGGQSMQTQKMKKVLEMAQNLPRACQWDQPQKCSIQPSWFA